MFCKIIKFATFCSVFVLFIAISLSAQTLNFNQTGKVRPIISEIKTESNKTKIDFYLSYKTIEKGVSNEKWAKLPNDRNWSPLSNQEVKINGNLKDNKLSNIKVKQLTKMPDSHLTGPPSTTGLYKFVTVPLTIEPQNARQRTSNLNITPEAIRNVLFDDPKSVSKFYSEASYGMFTFTGVHELRVDVIPVTIQANISNDCQNQIITEFTPIVEQRLLEQNINTSNGDVDVGIILFNNLPQCPPYPFTTRGALGERGTPLWLWMPESWFVTGPAIMSHEIGHVLGANHPAAMRCENFDDQENCVIVPNANDRDMMTFGAAFYLMPNNYERLRWGWHPNGTLINPSVGQVQMFDLQSPILPFIKESPKRGRFFHRRLSGVFSGGWTVFPESRRNYGRFEDYQNDDLAFKLGIAVRIGHANYGDPEALSLLLDPNTTEDINDAPLLSNQQLSIGGVEIKCLSEFIPNRGTRMRVQ